jgi:hypothetical protein
MIAANACGTVEGGCQPSNDACLQRDFGPRDYFLLVPASEEACGILELSVVEREDVEFMCFNAVDDDGNQEQDCEDARCQDARVCDSPISGAPEVCNGEDDGQAATFPVGAIDELACRCANDGGCNDLATGPVSPYICHAGIADGDGGPVCGPPCDVTDWCSSRGLVCMGDRCQSP